MTLRQRFLLGGAGLLLATIAFFLRPTPGQLWGETSPTTPPDEQVTKSGSPK